MKQNATVSLTQDALVIRIPWHAVNLGDGEMGRMSRKRRLTAEDVLDLVAVGRWAHRSGKTRSVRSLKELLA
jgi:hypothetical protein